MSLHLGAELAGDHHVSLGFAFVYVPARATVKTGRCRAANVAFQRDALRSPTTATRLGGGDVLLKNNRRILLAGLIYIHHVRADIVGHFDQANGVFGNPLVVGGHSRDGLAGETKQRQLVHIVGRRYIHVTRFATLDRARQSDVDDVNGVYTREAFCGAGIDAGDLGVGVRAAQDAG